MSRKPEPLQPYQPIQKITDGLWCVDGEWYETAFARRMTILRLKSGELVIHGAIRLEEKDLAELDRLGKVGIIVVPNYFHDSEAWFYADRYPKAKVYVPEKIAKKYAKRSRVTGTLEKDWPLQSELPRISLQRSWIGESVFVHLATRTLIACDMVFNMAEEHFKPGFERKLMKWYGVVGSFGPSWIFRNIAARNKEGVRATLREIAKQDFDRVIVGHGHNVETDGKRRFFAGFEKYYGKL